MIAAQSSKKRLGQRTVWQYDKQGRPAAARLPDTSTRQWRWNVAGRPTAVIDGKGGSTAYQWEQGQLSRRIDAVGRIIDYLYDTAGKLTTLINENNESYRFEYDAAGRQTAQIGLDGKRTELTLDPLGLPIEIREAAGTPDAIRTLLARDLLGRLIKKTTPKTITTYQRDALGQLLRIERTDQGGEPLDRLDFAYDAQGNLTKETQTHHRQINRILKTTQQTLTHTYDAVGNRSATTLPDGHTLNALHYGSGHLHQINLDGRIISDFARDALHRETNRTQGRLTHRTQYDPLSRILIQTSQPDRYFANEAHRHDGLEKHYQYDPDGELITRADTLFGRVAYRHDPTGRILAADTEKQGRAGAALHELHAYDAAANRLTPHTNAGFVRHNRIEVFEDKRYQYDAHGRVTEKRIGRHTTIHFQWNHEHQLIETVTEKNGVRQTTRYDYDALGRRIARHDRFGSSEFLWDGLRLLQERRYHKITTYVYQPGSHEPIARIDDEDECYKAPGKAARIYHFHNHINGAPEELTDEAGQIVWQGRYETWGNLALQRVAENFLPEPGREAVVSPQPLRMQGQYMEVGTGLCYNTFRYYDPDIGRFISEDPIGLWGGENLYAFAPNTDGWVDPWGWAGDPATATHITYRGTDAATGKPYVGYASMQGKHTAQEVLRYRYGDDFSRFGGMPPRIEYVGYGADAKKTARGLEQRLFEQQHRLEGTANRQNPVGAGNKNREAYLKAADRYLNKQGAAAKRKGGKGC